MSSSSVKKPSTRYGLIVFFVITLFLCAIGFYLLNNKGKEIRHNINQLAQIREDYSQIDSCIYILYNADNNSRLYAVTAEKKYIKYFFNDIKSVSDILDNLKHDSELNSPKNLKGLVDQKRIRTQLYLRLRELTDSLINHTIGIDAKKVNFKPSVNKVFKTSATIDTVKDEIKEKLVKQLFGSLADAFSTKKAKAKAADTTVRIVRTQTQLDTSLQSKNFIEMQMKGMGSYAQNLYQPNNMLKKNEIVILQINSVIIKELVSLLQEYKNKEKNFTLENTLAIKANIDGAFKSIDKMFLLSVGLLSVLLIAIIYNLWKIYKNENYLMDYSKQAAKYAISKSRFLANMSHEIRTPLNSVIGFSELLAQGKLSNQQTEQVNAIRSSSVMLLDVVNDILDFSKYETGKVSFDKINFVPFDAINDVFNGISIQANKKGIELKNEISFNRNLCFSGDSLRLKQVVMNLLSNAIKFTDKGSVTLKAEVVSVNKKNSLLKIQIIDTGIGISNDNIAMIFDEFAQVYYSSTTIKQKGTGLGLAICKKIVAFQGGQIGVSSELGKGSTFSFEIPYETCHPEQATESKNINIVKAGSLEGKRILLADDNKMNILLAQTVLKKYELAVDVAYDGKEAFTLFENNAYDLILTDVQMPVMGGLELTSIIRAYPDKNKAKIPILAVTANVLQEDRKKYIESGINDLVLKPFSEKELIDKIADYITKV